MGWIAFYALLAVGAIAAFALWRKWISPWKDARELADAIVEKRPPRKFLISGNPEARRVGLALETLLDRRGDLEKRARESESSAATILGAMPDGLAVMDDRRTVQLSTKTKYPIPATIYYTHNHNIMTQPPIKTCHVITSPISANRASFIVLTCQENF